LSYHPLELIAILPYFTIKTRVIFQVNAVFRVNTSGGDKQLNQGASQPHRTGPMPDMDQTEKKNTKTSQLAG
jgi:hypothetical protein